MAGKRTSNISSIARTTEHRAIMSLIEQGNSCLVAGLPYVGKTNLLNKVQAELGRGDYTVVFVDAAAVKGVAGFWRSVCQRVLESRGEIQEPVVSVRRIAEKIEGDEQIYVILTDEVEQLLSASSEEVKELLVGLKTLLNCGTLIIATSYRTREMWRDFWSGNEVIVNLLGEIFGREIIVSPWGIEEVRTTLRSGRVSDFIQDGSLREELAQLVLEETGGIHRLVDEVVARLQDEIEVQVQDNGELVQESGPHHSERTSDSEVQVWESVLGEIQDDAALFSGFWGSLPITYRQDLLLAFIRTKLREVGSLFGLSCAEFDRIIRRRFSAFSLSTGMGLFDEELRITSDILREWIERFVVQSNRESSTVEFVRSMMREVMDQDFSDAQALARYFEWSGIPPRLTWVRERKKREIQLWNNVAQRVIGFVLIGLTVLAILSLLRLL